MKKHLALSLALLMALVSLVAFSVSAETTAPTTCAHCQKTVEWTRLDTDAIRAGGPKTTGHYYLDLDETLANYNWMALTTIASGETVCLDLNGDSIYSTTCGYVISSGATLNIMDSVGGGTFSGRGRSDKAMDGGVLNIKKGGTANLYSGELTYVKYSSRYIGNGGVVYNAGEFNMYGGKITGGVATNNGGNVYVSANGTFNMFDGVISNGKANVNGGCVYADGTFNFYDGQILNGTAANAGGTVYGSYASDIKLLGGSISGGTATTMGPCAFARGAVTLSGDASVDELLLKPYPDKGGPELSETLTIKDAYTGTIKLKFADGIAEGADIGQSDNADISNAKITIAGSMLSLLVEDGQIVTAMNAVCDHCGKSVKWTALTEADAEKTALYTGHYYLAFSGDSCEFVEKNIYLDQTVCINLNGKQYKATTRAFSVFPGGTLNIMGDGTVYGRGGEGKKFCGGAIQISKDGTVNLYGGKLAYEDTGDANLSVLNGGTLSVEGTFNMYGGEVGGGVASNAAGTIFGESTSNLNFYGGKVAMGTATAAPCIYNKGRVLLAGDASVAQILIKDTSDTGAPGLADMVTVSGAYTGTTVLRSISAGQDIGISDSADLSNANLTIYNKKTLQVSAWGSDLIVTDGSKAMSADEAGTLTSYESAQAAVNACVGTTSKVILFADVTGTLNVTGNVTLDLNGKNVEAVTVADGAVLNCLDAMTADYDVSDGVYGKIKTYTGNVIPVQVTETTDGYLAIEEEAGTSFHRVNLQIKSMSLKPDQVGLYFLCDFAGDSMVQENLSTFGVALSAIEEPNADNMGTNALFTQFDPAQFNSGAENTSTLLYGIMKPTKDEQLNAQHAQMHVYGRAYVQMKDGNYMFGTTQTRSLVEQVEAIDGQFDSLNARQKEGMYSLLEDYKSAMSRWNIPRIVAAKEAEAFYAQVEKTATDEDIANLEANYAGLTPYMGDLHDHANTGGRSDGKQNLEVWKKYMEILDMDFATIVDHKQVRHMYLDDWDSNMFVGGTEAATWIKDYTHTADENGELHNNFHYNMIFADGQLLIDLLNEFTEFPYTGGDPLTAEFPSYPHFTRARMMELVQAILDKGGFFTHVHPKSPSVLISDNPEDYWFGDWTGIEVILSSRTLWVNQDNYKLWTDLLALGKKVYATAGSDNHNLPNPETMSTFYMSQMTAQSVVDNLRVGNFTAGMVGIRMSVEDTVMGSQAEESFAGKRLVFSTGDFHSSLQALDHDFRVELINDQGVVFSQNIADDETTYFAVDAEDCKFYRVVVYDATDNVIVAIGNPIWNAE